MKMGQVESYFSPLSEMESLCKEGVRLMIALLKHKSTMGLGGRASWEEARRHQFSV